MSDRFFHTPAKDPCAVFFKGFANSIKPASVSAYFFSKGFSNHVIYQRVHMQYFRLYLALKFQNSDTAQDVCQKFNKTIVFGYKIILSIFNKRSYQHIKYPFMQDKLRKLRAQAAHRPFLYKKRFYGHHSPARSFRDRSRRRSRSSSTDSDRSQSPDRKRRARSRETTESRRRRHHSHSHSRSSRSTSRSETPSRFSASPSNSKLSTSTDHDKLSDHSRKVSSKITVVENPLKKITRSSKERSCDSLKHSAQTKGDEDPNSPSSKERFLSNFSPVSFTSDDDAMLTNPTSDSTPKKDASDTDSYFNHPVKTPTHLKGEEPEAWHNSDEDATLNIRTPSSPRVLQPPKRQNYMYGKVPTYMMTQPWRLKPLTIQDGSGSSPGSGVTMKTPEAPSYSKSPTQQEPMPYHAKDPSESPIRTQLHQSPSDLDWSPSSSLPMQSPTSSFGTSPPKVNGLSRKPGRPNYVSGPETQQEKLAKLKVKKDDIIKAYKQDCDTFATVVRMLIRKDPELEHRLQQALRENLTEIGQRCVQELQETVEQMKE